MPPARRARAPPFLKGLVDVRPQGGEGRSQSANDASQHREHDREQHDLSIEADFLNTRQRFRQQAHAHSQRDRRQTQTEHASGNTQHQAFEYCLAQQRTCACSQGHPYGDLAPATDGADQQQSSKVGTRDQQHNHGGQKKRAYQLTSLLNGLFTERTHHRLNAQTRHESGIAAHRLLGHALGIALCLSWSDSHFKPSHHAVVPGRRSGGEFLLGEAHGNP